MKELPPDSIAKGLLPVKTLISSMLRDVIKLGTGRRAKVIGKKDLSAKQAQRMNSEMLGFPGIVLVATTVWVGFDKVAPLGRRETGAKRPSNLGVLYDRCTC